MEINSLVTDRYLTLLRSQTELTETLLPLNLSASQLREVIQKAKESADLWNSKAAADQRATLQAVLMKVRLQCDHVELRLSRRGLFETLTGTTSGQTSQTDKRVEATISVAAADLILIKTENCLEPMGNGLRLIINDANQSVPNLQLAPLLGESFMLREALLNGPHDSIEAMSNALQLGRGYITSRVRLTFLSPSLIKKILNGDVPRTISPTRLLEASKDLPVKWAEQDRYFATLAR